MKVPYHRFLSALCAVCFLILTLFPTAALAAQADGLSAAALTSEDAAQMQQTDDAVAALTDSDGFTAMSRTERLDAALEQLEQLAAKGLVSARSILVDEENGMVSFTYSCGVQGGILVDDLDEENTAINLSLLPSIDLQEMSNAPRGDLGSAMIYYAFDNTMNSSRYPYYSYMKGFWTAMGLNTRIDTTVTVSDLRRMDRYDLCILSAHGAYYTYMTGWLFKQLRTAPIILLTEESSFSKDLYYGIDLLTHRIIKINGRYCVTPSFFKSTYRFGQLENTIVYSETCEFLGVNNVYTVYSRSMLWDTVNHLILGQPIEQAVAHAKDTYGENDLVWYTSQGGQRPHAAAAYTMLLGDASAQLTVHESAPAFSEQQKAA